MHIAVMRYKLVPHYIFGSTGIICMFAKIYGKINNPPLVIGFECSFLLWWAISHVPCRIRIGNGVINRSVLT